MSEITMRSAFDDFSLIEDNDFIAMTECREPMSDDYRSLPLREIPKSILHSRFRLTVEMRGCLIKDDNRCILEKYSGNTDTLSLPARELDSSLTNNGFESKRQRINKFTQKRFFEHIADLSLTRIRFSIDDVMSKSVVEEYGFLWDNTNLGSKV